MRHGTVFALVVRWLCGALCARLWDFVADCVFAILVAKLDTKQFPHENGFKLMMCDFSRFPPSLSMSLFSLVNVCIPKNLNTRNLFSSV